MLLPAFVLLPFVATTLIPRKLLFSDPKYLAVTLSPDGKSFAYIAPDKNTVKNVFVKCTTCKHARQVTFERKMDVLFYSWTGVENVIIYGQDNEGDENMMLFKKNISEAEISKNPGRRSVISDSKGVRAEIYGNNQMSSRIVIGLNNENPVFHNLYSYDLLTDKMTLVMKNSRFPLIVLDNDMNIRLAAEEQPDGSLKYFKLSPKANPLALNSSEQEWEQLLVVQQNDIATTSPLGFDKSNQIMYWRWGVDSDLGTLVRFSVDNIDQKEVLYTARKAQIENIVFHPTDKTLLAITEIYHKPELFVANDTYMNDFQYLVNLRPHGSLQVLSESLDMTTWLVTYVSSDRPYEIFLYRTETKKAEFLFNTDPDLEEYKLNCQIGFNFKTRDNMVLQAYLSLPPAAALRKGSDVPEADRAYADMGLLPVEPQKLIVFVHGGPNSRDYYGYSPYNAFLTNRGYAVLQVNFRGSVGFGKRLTNAGNGEWGRKMHYDILDAVEFAVAKGIAIKSQTAIMGGSYGGYETLVALTFTPDEFACGVDMVGPSNLITLIKSVPPYWRGLYKLQIRMVGADIDTVAALKENNIPVTYILYPDEGHSFRKAKNVLAEFGFIEKFLHMCLGGRYEPYQQGQYNSSAIARSPLFFADRVKKPLMILQGANDARVKQQESDQFVAALKENNIPVTYILYPDEGHSFRKAKNVLAEFGFIEKFLHMCLGGRYEPYQQGQYNSSAILVKDGYPREE